METDITRAIQRARAYKWQDGFTEITIGVVALLIGCWLLASWWVPRDLLIVFLPVDVVVAGVTLRLMMVARSRVTYPRAGYVSYVPNRALWMRRCLQVWIPSSVLAAGLILLRDLGLSMWVPELLGLWIASILVQYGHETGLARLHVLAAISVLVPLGAVVIGLHSLLGFGLTLVLLGVALVLSGISALFACLRQNQAS